MVPSVCFLVLYQTFPYIGSSGRRYDKYKTDFDLTMSEITNSACRWVKTMPEILKSKGIHDTGNFVFGDDSFYSAVKSKRRATK